MATIDNALSTLTRLKSYLEISGSNKDFLLTMILISVSQYVEKYCNRKFKRQVFTQEIYSGSGTDKLALKNFPIISGETFTLQRRNTGLNDAGDWETLDSESYFINYESGVISSNTKFITGRQNFRVTYTGGFYLPSDTEYQDGTDDDKDLPYDLELAVLKICSFEYSKRKSVGVVSERVRDQSVTYAKAIEQDQELRSILARYRKFSYA